MRNPYFKDYQSESHLFKGRVLVASIVIILFFIVLGVRLYYLQVEQFTQYSTLSEQNRVTLLAIAPNRGLIYDRNGVLLVENVPAYGLHLIPEKVKNIGETLDAINAIVPLSAEDRQNFYQQLKYRRRFEGVPLKVNLDEALAAKFSVHSYQFPGVKIAAELIRHYPYEAIFSHAIGYVGRINEQEMTNIDKASYSATQYIGKTGIEQFYEKELHGSPGFQHAETDVHGHIIRILKSEPPTHGNDLYLTLDSQLQLASVAAMEGKRGVIVAIEPSTGGVLAFVSQPGFDPNLFVQGIGQDIYKQMLDSWERPLFNRILRGQYPPASTVKPMVALQGLQLGFTTPNYSISDPGFYRLPNVKRPYRDWRKQGHGYVNLHKAIVQSCDTYFYNLAHKMGIDPITDIYQQFGLGSPTGIDLIGELSGVVPGKEWKRANLNESWYPGETLITAIGQGFALATPLQLAHMATVLANQGERIKPHLVQHLQKQNGEIIQNTPEKLTPVTQKNPEHWALIQKSIHDVIAEPGGTAYRLSRNTPYTIAGKTGTAQVFTLGQNEEYDANILDEHLRDHALFIGYAPVESPQIALAIILENNTGAADVAKQVFDNYLLRTNS